MQQSELHEGQSHVNIKQLKTVLKHIISTNMVLQSEGHVPIAANIIGHAGLGKTSAIKQVGKELGFKSENIVLLPLASYEEVGDLVGMPVTEYRMIRIDEDEQGVKTKKEMWVKQPAMQSYLNLGFIATNDSRMTYSVPEWIEGKTGPGILILDDYTRASQRFTQAIMELILTQSYGAWSLPEGWTILLSSNPDNGVYNVTDQDPAQKTRYLKFYLKFDAEIWAEWAEEHRIDGRCINFILMNKEVVTDENPDVNARSITLFFNSIKTIPNFHNQLELIQLIGEGSLGVEATTMFTSFIHGKMDTLITVEEMLNPSTPFEQVEEEIRKLVRENGGYRADIAYIIGTRLLNHLQFKVPSEKIDKDLLDRLEKLICTDAYGSDLKFVIGRKITNLDGKYAQLLLTDAVVDSILD
jgi:hypothetical protein